MKPLLPASFTAVVCLAAGSPSQNRVNAIYEVYENEMVMRTDQHFHDGEYIECISILRIRQGMHPHDVGIAGEIVWMLGNLDRHGDALTEAVRFRRAHPGDPDAVRPESEIYSLLTRKLYVRIPPLLEPVIEKSKSVHNFNRLAKAYEELGLLNECLRIWELRLKRIPGDRVAAPNIERIKRKLADKMPKKEGYSK